jgi:hypothetical protein
MFLLIFRHLVLHGPLSWIYPRKPHAAPVSYNPERNRRIFLCPFSYLPNHPNLPKSPNVFFPQKIPPKSGIFSKVNFTNSKYGRKRLTRFIAPSIWESQNGVIKNWV